MKTSWKCSTKESGQNTAALRPRTSINHHCNGYFKHSSTRSINRWQSFLQRSALLSLQPSCLFLYTVEEAENVKFGFIKPHATVLETCYLQRFINMTLSSPRTNCTGTIFWSNELHFTTKHKTLASSCVRFFHFLFTYHNTAVSNAEINSEPAQKSSEICALVPIPVSPRVHQ